MEYKIPLPNMQLPQITNYKEHLERMLHNKTKNPLTHEKQPKHNTANKPITNFPYHMDPSNV